jgi:hypothetical protein
MKYNDPMHSPEGDAHHLHMAQQVLSDKKRHSAAKKHLGKMAKEKSKEAVHANAAKGLKKAFPSDQNTNPDQQNSKASAAASGQAKQVRGVGNESTVHKIASVPPLQGTSVEGY